MFSILVIPGGIFSIMHRGDAASAATSLPFFALLWVKPLVIVRASGGEVAFAARLPAERLCSVSGRSLCSVCSDLRGGRHARTREPMQCDCCCLL
jgi:hypothetical protein